MAYTRHISAEDLVAEAQAKRSRRRPAGKKASTTRQAAMLLKARFDAAEMNSNNTRHWAGADAASADAAASPFVRKILRERARYEVANNSYAHGMLQTLAADTIGTGPRLQLLTPNTEARRDVEKKFAAWCGRVHLADKLRTMRVAKCQDGEAFALLFMNPGNGHRVPLDFALLEADQVSSPETQWSLDPNVVEGIRFDRFRNPVEYEVLREHPGSDCGATTEFDRYAASLVVHYFRRDRAGQSRGIPEIAAALPMYNLLRRYSMAVLTAAEKAAVIAGVIKSNGPPPGDTSQEVAPFDAIDLNVGEWLTMPEGWDISQLRAEQPTTTYPAGKWEFVGEAARCISMPINIAMGNSSKHNYASGRLDHQMYHRAIWIERDVIERDILDRLFEAWLDEAALIEGYLPAEFRMETDELPDRRWFWDGFDHSDPTKEASAQAQRLANGTTNLAEECAAQGLDWRDVLTQRAAELKLMRELGIPAPVSHDQTGRPVEQGAPTVGGDEDEEDDDGRGEGAGEEADE